MTYNLKVTFYDEDFIEINGTGRKYPMNLITLHNPVVYFFEENITPIRYTEYKGFMFGDDECFDLNGTTYEDDTVFYQYFLHDGKLYKAWYATSDADGNDISLDEIDYEHPRFLTIEALPGADPYSDSFCLLTSF